VTGTFDVDDAADTLRFPSIHDIATEPVRCLDRAEARRRLIRATRHNIARLRDAIASGWDVGPELEYEKQQLAKLLMSTEAPFGCVTCGADPTHLVEKTPALFCAKCKPANATELCQGCRPRATDLNHPPGMIFVGWGHGWQPCRCCGGSGLERDTGEGVP